MKILIKTVILSTIVLLVTLTVYPCECVVMKTEKKLRKAKAVFVGEVVEIGSNEKSEWATVAVRFKVERYWKGIKEQFITVVGVSETAGACGLPVEVGEKYLIYAFKFDEGQLITSFCSSRSLENAKDDLSVIGDGKKLKLKR